ncbi:PREDICTED: uncharacterized protein LOC109147059 [Ipomoea nil]|uniref:uncharacterized protein LOC109147059 n=1 Tax=Ipomoea nil TaxID=35883 RepID=UPI000901619A|nr:PREDICTED: uncharacterized protein LOC109147059 [Ipomoea nil]
MGFAQEVCDNSLFTRGSGDGFIALVVYVDDVILASSDRTQIQQIKDHLHSVFQIKDLGSLKYFLGLEVARNHIGISLTQRKYALDLLQDAGFLESKPVKCHMVQKNKFSQDDSEALEDNTQYRRLLGKLLYLTITRPDICFDVRQLSQFLDKPTVFHLQVVHRVLRYIKGSPGQGLFFPADSNLKLSGFNLLIQIGQLVLTQEDLSLVFVCFWEMPWYPGSPSNKALYLDHPLKLSIEPLLLLFVKYSGCSIFFKSTKYRQ